MEPIDIKIIFGTVSSLLVLIGLIPYLKDIHYKKVHPQIISWFGWGFINGIGAIAMFSVGFNWGGVIILAGAVACFGVAGYSILRSTGVWATSKFDYLFFILGVIGIILWQTFNNPDLAIIFAILADLMFGIPNIVKIYKDPKSETIFPWAMAGLSGVTSLFAINYISFTEVAYPIYLAIYDFVILIIILFPLIWIRKILNNSEK